MDTHKAEKIITSKIRAANIASMLEDIGKDPYQTVFVIGAGLVEGGWEAFGKGVAQATGVKNHEIAPIHPTATLIYGIRFLAQNGHSEAEQYQQRLKLLDAIRQSVADTFTEYHKAGQLKLRITPETDYVEKLKKGRTLVITTNWDPLLEDYYAETWRYDVFSIHGNIRHPSGIYLPTESAIEPYRDPKEAGAHLRGVHRVAVEALEKANRIVIWASSLDVYDTELCTLLTESHRVARQEPLEYFVVDPCSEPAKRLTALLGDANITHIDPGKQLGAP